MMIREIGFLCEYSLTETGKAVKGRCRRLLL